MLNIENFVVLLLLVIAFISGMRLDNYYHTKSSREQKDALERQFIRLRAKADADDPCRPYGGRQYFTPIPVQGPITQEFMHELKTNGRAKTAFRKSDIAKADPRGS